MTPEQQAAFIIAQAVVAMGTIAGMQAHNQYCIATGSPPRYLEKDFEEASNPYVLGHNAVITFFQG